MISSVPARLLGRTRWRTSSPRGRCPSVDLQVADLAVHLAHPILVDLRVVGDLRVAAGHLRAGVLHIRQVDIHHAIQQAQEFARVVAAGVIDQGEVQPSRAAIRTAARICGTTWLGETRLTLWQPAACSSSIMAAISSAG